MRIGIVTLLLAFVLVITGCGKSINKILKSPDPEYKLRMAEKYYVKKNYNKAQILYEDIMPFYKTRPEFQDIYYKYAYCAYYQKDYMNAENLFKTFMEVFPTSTRAEEIDYMRAYSYYKQSPKPELDQTNTVKAMGVMQTFINTYPNSARVAEAQGIIEQCRTKLETKDRKSAQLYYDMGHFRAAAVAFSEMLEAFPESLQSDTYKLMAIKAWYRFAEMSVEEKKVERYEKVIAEYKDFVDRFPDSKLRKDAEEFVILSESHIKKLSNEQVKTPA